MRTTMSLAALAAIEYAHEVRTIHHDYEAFLKALQSWEGTQKAAFAYRVLEWRADPHKAPRLFTFLHGVGFVIGDPLFLRNLLTFMEQERRVVVDWFDDKGVGCPQDNVQSHPQLFYAGGDGPTDWSNLIAVMNQYDHKMDEYQAWLKRTEGQDEDP